MRRTSKLELARLIPRATEVIGAAIKTGNVEASFALLCGLKVLSPAGSPYRKVRPVLLLPEKVRVALAKGDLSTAFELLYKFGVLDDPRGQVGQVPNSSASKSRHPR